MPYSCGNNGDGALGDGTTISRNTLVQVSSIGNVKAVSAGESHSLFLHKDSTVSGSGYDFYSPLGSPPQNYVLFPQTINGLKKVTAVSAGGNFSLFLNSDSTVSGCGFNSDGQLGVGNYSNVNYPLTIPNFSNVIKISAGRGHSLFLKNNGTVWASGSNSFGELGVDSSTAKINVPMQVPDLTNVIDISAGGDFSLFLRSDGTVWVCGDNTNGQLGLGLNSFNAPLTQITAIANITAIAAGESHSLFLKSDGSVYGAGKNNYGTLGDGTYTDKSTPVQSSGLSDIVGISAGYYHSLFLANSGRIYSSGYNINGELGLGNTNNTNIPLLVPTPCKLLETGLPALSQHLFSMGPNPTTGKLQFEIEQTYGIDKLTILNTLGEEVYKLVKPGLKQEIDISFLPAGIYYFQAENKQGQLVYKVVKE